MNNNTMQQQVDEQPVLLDDGGGVLSLSLIHEVLEYIHFDMKRIIHRQEQIDGDNGDNGSLLPLSLIMNSGLEDYFEHVLLSERFKKKLCDECAKRGQLKSLILPRSKGCPWNEGHRRGACYVAAEAGHLHILQWAREQGCDWDSSTCSSALYWGRLYVLQWAIVSGCSMERDNEVDDDDDDDDDESFNLCESAADMGYWDIVKLAWDHGCSCSDNIKLQCIQHQLEHQSTQHQQQL